MDGKRSALAGCLVALAVGVLACGGGGEEAKETETAEARQQEWAWLQQAKQQLDAKRAQLADLHGRLEAAADAAAAEAGALEAEAKALEAQVDAEAEELGRRLIEHVNSLEIEVGAPLTAEQQAAIRLKSDEDAIVAREYIEQGGDYRRAIDIYEAALQVDPESPRLKEGLAEAEAGRWMTEERFGQAKKGMTRPEVRKALGQPFVHNIKEYPEKQTIAWFYPKARDGSAAGVFFQKKGSGPYKAYLADFNAVKAQAAPGR